MVVEAEDVVVVVGEVTVAVVAVNAKAASAEEVVRAKNEYRRVRIRSRHHQVTGPRQE